MRNDDRGSPLCQPLHGILNQKFSFRINIRRGLVKHQNFWISGKHPGKRQELALALGQVLAALCQRCVVPHRQLGDEMMCIHSFCRINRPLSGHRRVAQRNIVENRSRENMKVLQNHAHATT